MPGGRLDLGEKCRAGLLGRHTRDAFELSRDRCPRVGRLADQPSGGLHLCLCPSLTLLQSSLAAVHLADLVVRGPLALVNALLDANDLASALLEACLDFLAHAQLQGLCLELRFLAHRLAVSPRIVEDALGLEGVCLDPAAR